MATKIATCCYCGTRAALRLSGDVQHELACSACGAPLHDFKQMPVERAPKKAPKNHELPVRSRKKYEKKKKKKRKGFYREAFEELFDVVEDIFD